MRKLKPLVIIQMVAVVLICLPYIAQGGTTVAKCVKKGPQTGCKAWTSTQCSFLSPNYGIDKIGSWQCSGYNSSGYTCVDALNNGCCNDLDAGTCPSSVCPCPN